MIQFHLERSGVPAYLQLVQQVRQAIRLGVLRPGDQLPTVKEVVADADDQSRTRCCTLTGELDHEGLVEGRRGVGTFVAAAPRRLRPTISKELRSALRALAHARARGRARRRCDRDALLRHAPAPGDLEGRMTRRPPAPSGSASGTAPPGRYATARSRSPPAGDRARRPERRREDDAAAAGGRADPADRPARCACSVSSPRRAAALLPRVGFVAQDHPLHRSFTVARDAEVRALAQSELGRRGCSRAHRAARHPARSQGRASSRAGSRRRSR